VGRVRGFALSAPFRSRPAYRWTVEVSAYVASGTRRRGVGRGLIARLVEVLAEMGYRTAVAVIALPNEPSVRLHEALGFEPVGVFPKVGHKLGAWRDVGWWRLDLAPGRDDPPGPLSPGDSSIQLY